MPDIAIAPNPAATAANVANLGAAAAADSAAPGVASGPLGADAFAALLQKQLAGGSIDATAILLGTAESPAQSGSAGNGLAALLPQFLSALGLAQKSHGEAPGQAKDADDGTNDIPMLTDVYVPPAVPVTPAVVERAGAANAAAPDTGAAALQADSAAKLAGRDLPESLSTGADTMLPAAAGDDRAGVLPAGFQAAIQATQAAPARNHDRIEAPVGSRAFQDALGERMTWMVGQQQSKAEIVLNPPQLGRVEISLTMSGDNASALFVSANPAVRDTLEAALPRLREILADAGVTLGQAQVGSESARSPSFGGEKGDNSRTPADAEILSVQPGTAVGGGNDVNWIKRGRGLVDTFA